MVPFAEVVAQVAPVAGVVAQVAQVAEVVAQVAPVAEVVARSCWCRRPSGSRQVRLSPGCDTAWSSTSCCCIIEPRRIGIVRGRTGILGRGLWTPQGGPMRIVGG